MVTVIEGWGEGHREHWVADLDKVKIIELFSHVNITGENISSWLSSLINVLLPHLLPNFNPLLLTAPNYWMLQNLANLPYHWYTLGPSDESSRLLGQTFIHHLLPQQMLHIFSCPGVFSLSGWPQLLFYVTSKAQKLEWTSLFCTRTFFYFLAWLLGYYVNKKHSSSFSKTKPSFIPSIQFPPASAKDSLHLITTQICHFCCCCYNTHCCSN